MLGSDVPFIRFGVLRSDKFEIVYRDIIGPKNLDILGAKRNKSALSLSSISSVQICWNVEFIRKFGLKFDEALGLGNRSVLPSFGEEYLLALQCWSYAGSYYETTELIGVTRADSSGARATGVGKILLASYVFYKLFISFPRKSSFIFLQRVKKKLASFVRLRSR